MRIWVNNELGEFEKSLEAAENMLSEGGRLVTITFHSGEDSIVKDFLNKRSGKTRGYSRYQPIPSDTQLDSPTFSLLNKKAVKPSEEEVAENPRSRSAKLRAAVKLGKNGGLQ